jgi:hypothetical protein
MLRTVLLILLLSIAGMTKAQTENITFADANVKAICVANWDTDGDGELNQAEAAEVTNLDGMFMFDDEITTFDELSFFTGLTSIGEDEFNTCTSLTAISIPNAVTSIGNYAFSDCISLTLLTSYACTPPTLGNNVFDNMPSNVVVNVPCHTSAMYQTAEGWSDFSNYVEFEYGLCPIPFVDDNVKAICVAHWDTNGDGELSYAEAAAVTNLGTNFKSTSITSFDELEYFTSLASIPNTAFYGCTNLTSITLPSSVSALGNGSFYNCTNLATMTVYAETPPTVGTNAFKNVPTNMTVYVPCGTYDAYHNANGWSQFANIQEPGSCPIVFADANVKALCVANWDTNGDGELSYDEAAAVTDLGTIFKNNTNITSFDELQYFAGLSSIGYQAFYRCSALTSIIIPNPVISIDGYAFEGCSGLTSIEIPNSVTSIGDYAFYYCNGLTSVEIPSSVASLGTNSFGNCRILEQIMVDPSNAYFDSRENCNAVIKTNTNELVVGCKNTIIPNSVTSIGFCAFYCCQGLTSLEIPNSVISIGGYAFRYCTGLTSVTLGNSVTSIGHSAFDNCTGLTSIEIPNSVISIGYNAFFNCTGLTSLTFGNSLASIGNSAFYWCTGLTSMTVLSDNPPTIGNNAFYNVSTNIPVYVPCGAVEDYQVTNGWNSFTYITGLCSGEVLVSVNPTGGGLVTGGGYYAGGDVCVLTATPNQGFVFANWTENGRIVSLDSVYSFHAHPTTIVANFCSNSPIVFADTNVKALCVTHWDINGDGELSYAEAAMVIDIGDVFKNNSSIISFNELQYFINLTSIGFYNCTGLTSIEIPNSVTSIGDGAFYNCNSLTSINIPNSVTLIDGYAFEYCTSLTSVEIPNSVFLIGDNPFIGCSSLEQIMVASDNAYYDSRENCNAIIRTSTNILVAGCKNTVIPNSVVSIRNHAFYRCSGLTSIEIPNSVTSIGNSAFSSCTGLTSVVIPNSVISIGFQTFINCSSLTSVTIGNSVTSIDSYAFNHCSGLTTIISFAETPPIIDNTVFYSVNKSIPVYVPCGTTETYQGTNGWNEFTNIVGMCPGTIAIAASPTEGGTVTGGGSYEGGGTTCTLTATANHDYHFLNWTENGEVVSSDAEYTFTVAGDRNLVANFSFTPPAPVVAEYYPDSNEPNSPYVKVHWAASSFEAQIGEGTSTFGYFPFYTLYNYSISENLFLASELEEAGVNTATMTSLSWYATNAPGYEQQGISIWMANVSDTELTTTSHTVSGMTLVYTGTVTPEIGWNEFVFNEGTFAWDGTSNVLIFCQRNNGAWNSTVYWQATSNLPFNASSYKYQDAAAYDPTVAQTMTTSTTRPNIIMKGEGAMTYNLYRANCDGTDAQLIAENLNDTQYIDETWWQLENASYKYGVSIADSTNTDIFWSNCIEKQGNVVVQTVALSEGWNWLSTYIEREPVELLDMLKESLSENGIQIESQYDGLTEKIGDGYWWGDLDEVGIMTESMYLIEVAADCTVELEGPAVDPADHEITLYPEWTWIGFPCTEEVDIVVALSGLEAEEGDMIEGPDGVAEYLGGGFWYGIETLVPGQGYMYYSASDESKTLVFQTGRSKAKVKSGFIGNKAPKMSIERKVDSRD